MRALTVFVLLLLLATQGCAVVAVGAVAAAAAGVTYTMLGTAEKTFNEEFDTVLAALQKALVALDIKTGETKKTEEDKKVVLTEIEAYARDLIIKISVERITERATRVVVDASKKYVIKDAATAGEILIQTSNNLPKKS